MSDTIDWTAPSRRVGNADVGYLYKQGKCKICSAPLFGSNPVARDLCGHCILERGKAAKGNSDIKEEDVRDWLEAIR